MNSLTLNKVVHEQARLKILVMLASTSTAQTSFTDIKTALVMTAGNLSIQLKTLEEAGYIAIHKYINGNKPQTDVSITQEGRDSLVEYVNSLESLLDQLKSGGAP